VTRRPQTAFGRTLALLLALAAFVLVGTVSLGGVYRARAWADTVATLAQTRVQLIAPIVATLGPADAARFVAQEYADAGLELRREPTDGVDSPVAQRLLGRSLAAQLDAGTDILVRRDHGLTLWLRTPQTDGWWLGMPLPTRGGRLLPLFAVWLAVIAVIAGLAALWFARALTLPLRRLAALAPALANGELPDPSAIGGGPREVRALGTAVLAAAEQARQARDERELWLAGVSHDLRTPLARLRFSAEMLPEGLDLRAGMIDDVEAMDAMLGQFLDYLRLGRDEVVQERDVGALLREAVARMAGAQDVAIEGELIAAVRPQAVTRGVGNLVLNALRHGAPPVRVEIGSDGGGTFVAVHDAGAGFDPAQLAALTVPFVQGEAARGGDGTGLGLAIAARAAALHGGALRAARDTAGFCVAMHWPRTPVPAATG
jgi:two-component system osmolarity sensor histidine kinase EnvZ